MMDNLNSTTTGMRPDMPRIFARSLDACRASCATRDLTAHMTTTTWEDASMSGDASIFWSGHLPATRAALEGILNRAASGQCHSTARERVFATVCEFRATIANGGIYRQYAGCAPRKLKSVHCALNAIGADEVAAVVGNAIFDLERNKSRACHVELLRELQTALLALAPSLDWSISAVAQSVAVRIDCNRVAMAH